ncbi:MAG: hypothetical protein NVS2B2_08600 [Ktedonobacteraceae bacterium]
MLEWLWATSRVAASASRHPPTRAIHMCERSYAEVVWVISHTKDGYGTLIVSVEFRYPRAKEMPIAPTSAIHTSYTCIL